jgi:hypothetical protein
MRRRTHGGETRCSDGDRRFDSDLLFRSDWFAYPDPGSLQEIAVGDFGSSGIVIYATASNGQSETIVADADTLLDFVADELLMVYNAHWRDPDQPELDRAGFLERIVLPVGSMDCSWDESGRAEISLDSGELFCDHSVRVTLDRTGAPLLASIE